MQSSSSQWTGTRLVAIGAAALVIIGVLFLNAADSNTRARLQSHFTSRQECKQNCQDLLNQGEFIQSQVNPCERFCDSQPLDILKDKQKCFDKCKTLCEPKWPSSDCVYDCALVCKFDPILEQNYGPLSLNGYWKSDTDPTAVWKLKMDQNAKTFQSVALSPRAKLSVADVRGNVDETGQSGKMTLTAADGTDVEYPWTADENGRLVVSADAKCFRMVRTGYKSMNDPIIHADDLSQEVTVTPRMDDMLKGEWKMTMEGQAPKKTYVGEIFRENPSKNLYKMRIKKDWSKKFIKDFELRFTGEKKGIMKVMYHKGDLDVPFAFVSPSEMRFFNMDGSLRTIAVKQ